MGIGIGTKRYADTGHQNGNGVDTQYPDWWEYDPQTNLWTQVTSRPASSNFNDLFPFTINEKGYFPALADDRVNFTSEEVVNFEVEVYDLLGNSVTSLKPMN